MAESTILIIIGALLTLIGILGGGFEIKEAKIPKVGLVPRVMALVIGMAILTIQLYPKFIEGESAQGPVTQVEQADKPVEPPDESVRPTPEPVPPTPVPVAPTPVPVPLSGVYTIQQKSTGRYVDAHETSGKDYRLVTRDKQENDTQRWILKPLGDNTYTIQQKSTGRYVDAHETSRKDYRLVTRGKQENDTQRWILEPLGDNTYTIQQKSNRRYVDAYENKTLIRDYDLVTRDWQDNDTQRWLINPL